MISHSRSRLQKLPLCYMVLNSIVLLSIMGAYPLELNSIGQDSSGFSTIILSSVENLIPLGKILQRPAYKYLLEYSLKRLFCQGVREEETEELNCDVTKTTGHFLSDLDNRMVIQSCAKLRQ